ncbi:MAG: hypothetical protein IPG89_17735 [Bacteroidetes bacterium]|nr:hypothetical protein [Bacteroidota bacterium]
MKACFFIVLIGLSALFVSCSNPDRHKEKINALDSLKIELDKKIAVFSAIDTLKIARSISSYNNNIKWMRENIKDTLSVTYLNTLKKYQTVNDPLLFLQGNFSSILKDAQYSRDQLLKLSSDLKKNLVEDERAFEFYTIEKMEAEKMNEVLQSNYQLAKESIDTFDKYNNEIEKLITSYKIESK